MRLKTALLSSNIIAPQRWKEMSDCIKLSFYHSCQKRSKLVKHFWYILLKGITNIYIIYDTIGEFWERTKLLWVVKSPEGLTKKWSWKIEFKSPSYVSCSIDPLKALLIDIKFVPYFYTVFRSILSSPENMNVLQMWGVVYPLYKIFVWFVIIQNDNYFWTLNWSCELVTEERS